MKVLLIFPLTLLATMGFAQPDADSPVRQNAISITLGYNQFKDENLHPKVFHGLLIGSAFRHTSIRKNLSEYTAGLKLSAINTDYEEFPSAAGILILGKYRYLFAITGHYNLKWYLGPAADLQYGTNAYFNWDESHLYFANYLSAGIGSRVSCSMSNKTFDFNLDIPLISVLCRPDYNRQYKIDDMTFGGVIKNLASNPEAAFPDKNFYVKTGLEMKFNSKSGKTRSVGYQFMYHYVHAGNGNPYQNIENSVTYYFIF